MVKKMNEKMHKSLHIAITIVLIVFLILFLIKIIIPVLGFSIMQGDYTKTGIENYSPYNSLGLTHYFTLRDETEEKLFEKFEYENVSYRYHYFYKGTLQHELVIAIVKYPEQHFNLIKEDITSSVYYGDFMCTYMGFDFHFNDTPLTTIHKWENYNINTDAPFIRYMNCVGINSDNNSIIFIGFYYTKQKWISGNDYDAYNFSTWDSFFEEFFPEITS